MPTGRNDNETNIDIESFLRKTEISTRKLVTKYDIKDDTSVLNEVLAENQKCECSTQDQLGSDLTSRNPCPIEASCNMSRVFKAVSEEKSSKSKKPLNKKKGRTIVDKVGPTNIYASMKHKGNLRKGTYDSNVDGSEMYHIPLQARMLKYIYRSDGVTQHPLPKLHEEDIKDGSYTPKAIESHPIRDLIKRHLQIENIRSKTSTQDRLKSMVETYDLKMIWDSRKTYLTGDVELTNSKKKSEHPGMVIRKDSHQMQSVPLEKAIYFFNSKHQPVNDYNFTYTQTPEPIRSIEAKEIIDKRQDQNEFDIETLVVNENVCGDCCMSIYLYKFRNSNLQFDQVQRIWDVRLYKSKSKYIDHERFMIRDIEVLKELNLTNDPTYHSEVSRRILVHRQGVKKIINDKIMVGKCSVWVKTIESLIYVDVDFYFDKHGEIHKISPLSISNVPIYEIIAVSGMQKLCVSFDFEFWSSTNNSHLVWNKLIKMIQLKESHADAIDLRWSYSWTNLAKVTATQSFEVHRKAYLFITSLRRSSLNFDNVVAFMRNHNDSALFEKASTKQLKRTPLSARLMDGIAFTNSLLSGYCTLNMEPSRKLSGHKEYPNITITGMAVFETTHSKNFIPSVMVATSISLDSPIFSEVYEILDQSKIIPESIKDTPTNVIPDIMAKGQAILRDKLQSTLDTVKPHSILLIDSTSFRSKYECSGNEEERDFPYRLCAHDHMVDCSIHQHIFGVTENGVTSNKTDVHPRLTSSCEDFISLPLSRKQTAIDFQHMIINQNTDKDGGTQSIPLFLTVKMNHKKVASLSFKSLKAYHDECREKLILESTERKKKSMIMKNNTAEKIFRRGRQKEIDSILREEGVSTDVVMNYLQEEDCEGFEDSLDESGDNTLRSYFVSSHFNQVNDDTIFEEKSVTDNTIQRVDLAEDRYGLKSYGWRMLPRAIVGADFFKFNKNKVKMMSTTQRRYNDDIGLLKRSDIQKPTDAIDYKVNESMFQTLPQTNFLATIDIQLMRPKHSDVESNNTIEHKLAKIPDTDNEMMFNERQNDLILTKNMPDMGKTAIIAVKTANYSILEEALDEHGLDVDTRDEFGNTLLILACQQGNKKLSKFLLRRGAYINCQNLTGNSVLHYLFEYGHSDLAHYLIRKGADDSLLNADGLTCYEGVNKKSYDIF